jgi:hypothetical protein
MEDCTPVQSKHTADLAVLNTKVNMLEKVFELSSNLHNTLVGMASDNQKILLRLEHQGESLDTLVTAIQKHEDRFDNIEIKMGTKDTIVRLHERVDELEKKDGQKAEKLLGQIKWLLVSLIITGVFGIVWTLVTNK